MTTSLPAGDSIEALVASHRAGFSMARAFYQSPTVYEAEQDRIFQRSWHYAGHVSQCAKPGDYFLDEFAGDSLVVIRGRDDRIRAFHNVCRHRGSRLRLESSGCVRSLVCPYHAWTYGLDGRLLSAPAMGDLFDPGSFGLKECPARILGGLIMVCPGIPSHDMEATIRDFTPFLDPHRLIETRIAATQRWPTRANWKLVVENFSECYHCGIAHPEYSSVMAHARQGATGDPRHVEQFAELTAMWAQSARAQGRITGSAGRLEEAGYQIQRLPVGAGKVVGARDGRPVAPLLGGYTDFDGGVTAAAVRPFLNFYIYNDHAVILNFIPRGPVLTDTAITWLVCADAVEDRDYKLEDLTWLWRVTTDEDKRLLEDNQAGVSSCAYEPGPYSTKVEQGLPRFHRWYFRHLQ